MRSVVVVLPASMWAMIPMLRVFSSGTLRGMRFVLVYVVRGRKKALRGPIASQRVTRWGDYEVAVSIDTCLSRPGRG